MLYRRYQNLLLISLVYTLVMLLPGLAEFTLMLTYGLAFLLNIVFATIAVYGLALLPALRLRTPVAWIGSFGLIAIIAVGPSILFDRFVAQELAGSDRVSPEFGPISSIEVQSVKETQNDFSESLITSLLSGGMVKEVRLNRQGQTALFVYSLGENGKVQLRFEDPSVKSDLKIEIKEDPAFTTAWKRWMFQIQSPRLLRGVDGASGTEVFSSRTLAYREPLLISVFYAGGSFVDDTRPSGFRLLPVHSHVRSRDAAFKRAFESFSVSLGEQLPIERRPGQEEVFRRAQSLLQLNQPLTSRTERFVWKWIKSLEEKPEISPEEINLFRLIYDRSELDGDDWLGEHHAIIRTWLSDPILRRETFPLFMQVVAEEQPEMKKFFETVVYQLGFMRLEPELAERYAPEYEAFLRRQFVGRTGAIDKNLLWASEAFGLDPVELFYGFRDENWRRSPNNVWNLHALFWKAPERHRRKLAEDIIAGTRAEAADRTTTLKNNPRILREIREMGYQQEIEEVLEIYFSNPENANNVGLLANRDDILGDQD